MRLIYFTAKWCSPCKRLRPIVEKETERFGVALQVVDIDERPDLAIRHQIQSVPTLILVGEEQPIGMLTGDITRAKLVDLLVG